MESAMYNNLELSDDGELPYTDVRKRKPRRNLWFIAAVSALLGSVVTAVVVVAALAVPVATQPLPLATPGIQWNTIKDIESGRLWQDTGIQVQSGQRLLIEVVSGEWRKSPNDPFLDGLGSGYVCRESDCIEPLSGHPTDALIGRIGEHVFFVGQRLELVADQAGTLSLRMNDGDGDMWDNEGTLRVGVLIQG
jgi:hypothetical protein